MACSAILVLDLKGRVLLARDYRGDIPLKYADRFIAKVNELEDAGKLTPVITDEGVTYLYVQCERLKSLAPKTTQTWLTASQPCTLLLATPDGWHATSICVWSSATFNEHQA